MQIFIGIFPKTILSVEIISRVDFMGFSHNANAFKVFKEKEKKIYKYKTKTKQKSINTLKNIRNTLYSYFYCYLLFTK